MKEKYTLVDWRNSDLEDYQEDIDNFLDNLEKVINKSEFGLTADGVINRWCGAFDGGMYINDISDMYELIRGGDLVVIVVNGCLHICVSHHDDSNTFEIRRVTKRGHDRVLDTALSCGYSKIDKADFLRKSKYYTRRCCKNKSELELLLG